MILLKATKHHQQAEKVLPGRWVVVASRSTASTSMLTAIMLQQMTTMATTTTRSSTAAATMVMPVPTFSDRQDWDSFLRRRITPAATTLATRKSPNEEDRCPIWPRWLPPAYPRSFHRPGSSHSSSSSSSSSSLSHTSSKNRLLNMSINNLHLNRIIR